MNKIKVMTVFGTRPEAIKMAPLVKKLESNNKFESIVCVTAQHREMLDMVLDLFNISPKYDLNIMRHGQTITDITNRVLKELEEVIGKEKPDVLLVHGDTTTTFAASLAAFYNKVPVGHVEAGLRSGNIYSPYPEEMNRRLTGTIASIHFAPTNGNKENLLNENISEDNIFITGNTVIDALLSVVNEDYKFNDEKINNVDFKNKKVILLTCHRRENWGKPMENIFRAIKRVVIDNENVEVIFPMHLNPKVRDCAKTIMGDMNRIHLIEPLDYEPFANLMNKVDLVLTDSGGIQEEAPSLGKPVLVLRTETERPEAVSAGTVKVIGINEKDIYEATNILLNNEEEYFAMAHAVNPYGDGKACDKIVDYLLKNFDEKLDNIK
ncbi:non-hydrolyzing UDP-N-acetylglucosamine 2-epimerase [Tepidibacter formicigenes]|jgi:UDP-N-acetylglucosamine 2-epimerase (non-hydrolysing)|uniref:UDP-N-acetylglucosamine 2-epimerase (non-hydrolyzing) n=1 Tax=Tepidibacter formicigenes DSM 15518 TaxID=1123349 RepID=A0A1M6MQN4_9FIRM|nr:UDP-N-acetylglucosamine 2-epimerase (non-hydrolyzing) [Tepidibacter formicigenes]SHJ85754.1 UDP-N-Acetylglucosamine 2-epimerase [Tepidibacter formicigenes DSM 15518]